MPPQYRDDNGRMNDILRLFTSGQLLQGWHQWQDFIHRKILHVGYASPLPAATLKIKILAVVLLIVWTTQTIAWVALFLTIDSVKEDLGPNGRFQEFYAIRRVLEHIMAIICIVRRFRDNFEL